MYYFYNNMLKSKDINSISSPTKLSNISETSENNNENKK